MALMKLWLGLIKNLRMNIITYEGFLIFFIKLLIKKIEFLHLMVIFEKIEKKRKYSNLLMGSGPSTLDDYKYFANESGINYYDEIMPMTLLDYALLNDHQESISWLVENGAKENNEIVMTTFKDNSPLHKDLNNLILEFL